MTISGKKVFKETVCEVLRDSKNMLSETGGHQVFVPYWQNFNISVACDNRENGEGTQRMYDSGGGKMNGQNRESTHWLLAAKGKI